MATSNGKVSPTWISAVLFISIPVVYYCGQRLRKIRRKREEANTSLSKMARSGSQLLKPPFPELVREMLSKCRLAYLSTVDNEMGSSHLSLMRFTYLNDEHAGEIVIMSTNRRTKKFDMLRRQKGVALLVHDFGLQDNRSNPNAGLYSITLNGSCRIIEDTTTAEYYRSKHLAHNPDYPQFIVGDDIAMLCIDVTSARICDINDQVTKWEVEQMNN